MQAAEWDKTSDDLTMGAEVTAFGELSGQELNQHSFWATVTKVLEENGNLYQVTDAFGKHHEVKRSDLRYRKRHSVASGHVTARSWIDTYLTVCMYVVFFWIHDQICNVTVTSCNAV